MIIKHFKLAIVTDIANEHAKINLIQSMKPKLGYYKPDILIGMVAEKVLESECRVVMVKNRYITKHIEHFDLDTVTANPVVNSYLKDLQDKLIETLMDYLPRIPNNNNYFTTYGYVDVDNTILTINIQDV